LRKSSRQFLEHQGCADEHEGLGLEEVPTKGQRIEDEADDHQAERREPQRMHAASKPRCDCGADCERERGLQQPQLPVEVRAGLDDETEDRPRRDAPPVVEHPKASSECEGRKHRDHHACLDEPSDEGALEPWGEEEHDRAEHAPELDPSGEADERTGGDNAVLAGVDPGEHPEQRHDRLRRMSVDECPLRQTGCHGEDADEQADAIADLHLPEHVEQEDRDRQLEQERKRREVANCPEDHQLQRAGLKHRVRERVRPAPGKQLLALVHEVDEVARIRPSIEVGADGREAENRYPDSGDGRAQKVPHKGRYRPLEG